MKKKSVNKPYHFKGCGLDNVYLLNGYEYHETPEGIAVSIKSIDELHQTIAMTLARSRKKLSGKEIKYLRHFMDISQAGLAKILDVDAQTIARWEKEESKVAASSEAIIRVLVIEKLGKTPGVTSLLKQLSEEDNRNYKKKREFSMSKGHWGKAA